MDDSSCGVQKLIRTADPLWAHTIKDLVKFRAREQQARAVAAVVEATAKSRLVGLNSGIPL